MTSRVLIDTSILIGFYNESRFEETFLALNRRSQLFFSVVTVNELIRGSHTPPSKRIIEEFLTIAANRLLTPVESQWIECGYLSEQLLRGKRRTKESILLLQNDILIGLCARDERATLITADRKDFSLLKNHVDNLSVEFWE